jgi:hypothetical protein
MSTILHRREMHVAITADESAKELVDSSADVQAVFFAKMAWHIANWAAEPKRPFSQSPCWAIQCRFIADEMLPIQRAEAASVLETLIEHLREVRECHDCDGSGRVPDNSGNFPDRPGVNAGPFIEYMECPTCNGTKIV